MITVVELFVCKKCGKVGPSVGQLYFPAHDLCQGTDNGRHYGVLVPVVVPLPQS